MKRALLLFLALSLLVSLDGYGQGWEWGRETSCGTNNSPFTNLGCLGTTDKWCNIYVGGINAGDSICFGSYKFYNPNPYTPTDTQQVVIVKYDSSGNLLWARASSHGNAIPLGNVTTDIAGNLYLFGAIYTQTIQFDTHILTNPNYNASLYSNSLTNSYFIVKYNPSGNVVWAKTGDQINTTLLQSGGIITDKSGNIYVCGAFLDSIIHIGPFTLINPYGATQNNLPNYNASDNIFIAKYDSSGNVIWAKSFGGTKEDEPTGIAISNDKVYLTGSFQSPSIAFGATTLTSPNTTGFGSPHLFLTQLDTAGNVIWAKGSIGIAAPFTISVDNTNNGIYIGGYIVDTALTLGTCSFIGSQLFRSAFLAKYDSSGNTTWAKKISPITSPIDSLHIRCTIFSITTDPCSNVWVNGQMTNDSILIDGNTILRATTPSYLPTMFLEFTSTGILQQSQALPLEMINNYITHPLATDSAGNIYLCGDYRQNSLTLGNLTLQNPSHLYGDIFIAKYNPNTCHPNLNVPTNNNQLSPDITLYPNPANNECTIRYDGDIAQGTKLIIYDMAGRLMLTYPITTNISTIPITQLSPGIYQCRIITEGRDIITKKLVVIR